MPVTLQTPMQMQASSRLLVHLATGIGNIMHATPLLVALSRSFSHIELRLDCDYPGAGDLFRHWSALRAVYDTRAGETPGGEHDIVIPAVPPFAWPRYAGQYRHQATVMPRPPDGLFYSDEQSYYLDFARRLGCNVTPAPCSFVPAAPPTATYAVSAGTLVLAPGCKTGIMAAKRWPSFPELAEHFDDVVVVGTADDLRRYDGTPMTFPAHVRSLTDRLSLQDLAGLLASCGAVVANDSGIGHLAAAAGAVTLMIFGPTPNSVLGRLSPNVTVLRSSYPCNPCWFEKRLAACAGRATCLSSLSVDTVAKAVGAFGIMSSDMVYREAAGFP